MKKPNLSRRDRLELLFRSRDDESLLEFTLNDTWDDHWRWAQKECLERLSSPDEAARRCAFWGLGVLAMHKHLEPEVVIPRLKDFAVAEADAQTALENVYQHFPEFRPSDWKEPPPPFVPTDRGREELERMLESSDQRTVCVALWDAANNEEDWLWVQTECLKRLKSSKELQYGALVGLNYLALRGELEPDVVLSALNEVEEGEWTSYIRENIYRFWKPQ